MSALKEISIDGCAYPIEYFLGGDWKFLAMVCGANVLGVSNHIMSWLEFFLEIYQTRDVTPYTNALCFHVPEFLSLYQNISYCTQQGMEKYNDRASKDYFRSTNHKGIDALKGAMSRRFCCFGSILR